MKPDDVSILVRAISASGCHFQTYSLFFFSKSSRGDIRVISIYQIYSEYLSFVDISLETGEERSTGFCYGYIPASSG
jgi:hypothetical protein